MTVTHPDGTPLKKIAAKQSTPTSDTTPKVIYALPAIKFWLYARIAANFIGNVGKYASTTMEPDGISGDVSLVTLSFPDLHFTLIIEDGSGGTWGVDGQPMFDIHHFLKIKSNYYINVLPPGIEFKRQIQPPSGMSGQTFREKLMANAHNFSDGTFDYSAPKNIVGGVMNKGSYNSSSYMSGLLNSVMGYVPEIDHTGYKIPGWESAIPASAFQDGGSK